MAVEIVQTPSVRLTPGQELKLNKPDTELYVGQILKTVVVKALSENQVMININGQNINAETSHRFNAGELLQVKVTARSGHEAILQVLRESPQLTAVQKALAQALPRQASATHLLATLAAVENRPELPAIVRHQIHQLLASLTPLAQLPQQLGQAIQHSGLFWEATLLNWRRSNPTLDKDFKGQCLGMLGLLADAGVKASQPAKMPTLSAAEPLPLPGAIPQPMHRQPPLAFEEQTIASLLAVLREQTEQTLARIQTGQLTHLMQQPEKPYSLMLDLPLQTDSGPEVIPLLISEHRPADPAKASTWSISFAVHLEPLGDIQAKVSLQDKSVDIQIHSSQQETLELLQLHQHTFNELLSELELELRVWGLHPGLQEPEMDTSGVRLLDIRI